MKTNLNIQRYMILGLLLAVLVGCNKTSQSSATTLLDDYEIQSGRTAGDRMVLRINGVEYAFRQSPPGNFKIGSPSDESNRGNDEKQHEATLTHGFWMGETEVTQEQWESVMGNNPSHFKGGQLPVESVSWNDCQDYIKKLNDLVSSDYRFSLPTETQWEYVCRAGTTTVYSFGDSREELKEYAWFGAYHVEDGLKASSEKTTNVVGQKKSNVWGLYDMHGNVWEWCNDWYGDYPSGSVTNPTGATSGSDRVVRGGGGNNGARCCRSAFRSYSAPDDRLNSLGLRLCLVDASRRGNKN
ncbi:MAG: formylglycine-generating enzyme family protein [Planctomycetaceae bacterium]|nr:formylglycine-generating enzyme family protein [Planctomycetaceae bacterium]